MSEYTDKMSKAIEATEREFSKIRAGKASPAILNDVRVDYYGTPTPISQVAKVSVPEPRMLLVTPWEKTMVDPIEKAILAANIVQDSRAGLACTDLGKFTFGGLDGLAHFVVVFCHSSSLVTSH